MKKALDIGQITNALKDVEFYLTEAQYLLQGERQLNVQTTTGTRENINRALSRLQFIKEFYRGAS